MSQIFYYRENSLMSTSIIYSRAKHPGNEMVSFQLDPEYGWVLMAAVATYSIEKWMVSCNNNILTVFHE